MGPTPKSDHCKPKAPPAGRMASPPLFGRQSSIIAALTVIVKEKPSNTAYLHQQKQETVWALFHGPPLDGER
ncbi:hypothetical protein SLE2022_393220 [Rubroshorea leprosula]